MAIQESGTRLEDEIDGEKAGDDLRAHQDNNSSDMGTDHLKSYDDTHSDTLRSESSVCNRSGENANCSSSKASAKVAVDQEVTDGFDVYTGDDGDEDEASCRGGSGATDGVDVSTGDGDDDDEAGGLGSVTDAINVSAGDGGDNDEASGLGSVTDGVNVPAGDNGGDDEAGGLGSVTDGVNVSAGDDEADEADIYESIAERTKKRSRRAQGRERRRKGGALPADLKKGGLNDGRGDCPTIIQEKLPSVFSLTDSIKKAASRGVVDAAISISVAEARKMGIQISNSLMNTCMPDAVGNIVSSIMDEHGVDALPFHDNTGTSVSIKRRNLWRVLRQKICPNPWEWGKTETMISVLRMMKFKVEDLTEGHTMLDLLSQTEGHFMAVVQVKGAGQPFTHCISYLAGRRLLIDNFPPSTILQIDERRMKSKVDGLKTLEVSLDVHKKIALGLFKRLMKAEKLDVELLFLYKISKKSRNSKFDYRGKLPRLTEKNLVADDQKAPKRGTLKAKKEKRLADAAKRLDEDFGNFLPQALTRIVRGMMNEKEMKSIKSSDDDRWIAREELMNHILSSLLTDSDVDGSNKFDSAKQLLESMGLHLEKQLGQSKVEILKCQTDYFIILCDVKESNKVVSHLMLSYGSNTLQAVGTSPIFLADPVNLDQSKIDALEDPDAKKIANNIFKELLTFDPESINREDHKRFGIEVRTYFKVFFKPKEDEC